MGGFLPCIFGGKNCSGSVLRQLACCFQCSVAVI